MSVVLFVHGLESGPHGRKARAIQAAGYRVLAEQMPCGRKAILRNPDVLAFLSFCGAGAFGSALAFGLQGLFTAAGASSTLALLGAPLLARQVLQQSVEVQANILASHPVDLVLGSSFGGAVCIELLAQGIWKGPTVLLCPAHQRVAALARKAPPKLPPGARVLVVHGLQDSTVPVEHSRALARQGATLLEVDDDHRLSASATPENLRSWIEQAQTMPAASG